MLSLILPACRGGWENHVDNVHHGFRLPLRSEAFQFNLTWLFTVLHFSPAVF